MASRMICWGFSRWAETNLPTFEFRWWKFLVAYSQRAAPSQICKAVALYKACNQLLICRKSEIWGGQLLIATSKDYILFDLSSSLKPRYTIYILFIILLYRFPALQFHDYIICNHLSILENDWTDFTDWAYKNIWK